MGHSSKGKDWRPFVYGGLASVIAETGTFPIDTTKTRLQVQGQVHDAKFRTERYRGMFHALHRIGREEGVLSLYNGVKPAILRQLTYGTIKFGIYYSLKNAFVKDHYDDSLALSVVFGVTSGVIAASIANPTDLLKVRMQAQNVASSGMWKCFKHIYLTEGLAGLWKGVCPTAQRAAVCAGVELPVYDITKKHLLLSGLVGDTPPNHFISSFVAGLAGALASTPIDVVRTRIMNQQRGRVAVAYNGAFDCAMQTVRSEGFLALYRGFIPTWVRLGPWNIIFFLVFERLKVLY